MPVKTYFDEYKARAHEKGLKQVNLWLPGVTVRKIDRLKFKAAESRAVIIKQAIDLLAKQQKG